MSTSKVVSLVFFILAALLFVLVGFGIVNTQEEDYNLVALGLASFVVGYIAQHFIP